MFNKKVIKFKLRGHKGYPVYEIIVCSKIKSKNNSYPEKIGFYNPNFSERCFFIDSSRLAYWLNRGAVINSNVKKYIVKMLF